MVKFGNIGFDWLILEILVLILIVLSSELPEHGELNLEKHRQRHQHGRLAAHDERERKSGCEYKMRRIELAKSFEFVVA